MLKQIRLFWVQRKKLSIFLLVLLFSLLSLAIAIAQKSKVFTGNINQLELNLKKPDVLLISSALSQLPRDVQQIPLLKNVLTEDFVFYYEQHEELLSLKGTLKRLAFEHQLQLQDKVLKASLDVPAQIALWNDAKGAPRHAMLVLKRTVLARLIEQLAKVPATDMQLAKLTTLTINHQDITVYALRTSGRQTLAILSYKDSVVIATDVGMLIDSDKKPDSQALELLSELLSQEVEVNSVWSRQFNHEAQLDKGILHTIDIGSRVFGQNYNQYFPDLKAVQLRIKSNGQFQLAGLVNDDAYQKGVYDAKSLWQSLPNGLGLCVALPLDWQKLNQLLPQEVVKQSKSFSGTGPAAVCWSDKGRLLAPLFLAKLTPESANSSTSGQDWQALYAWAIRLNKQKLNDRNVTQKNDNDNASDASTSDAVATTPGVPFGIPVNQVIFKAVNDKSFLIHLTPFELKREIAEDQLSFNPSLLKANNTVAFSLDAQLIEKVALVEDKKFPSLSDSQTPFNANTMLWISPNSLSKLFVKEAKPYMGEEKNTELVSRIEAFGTFSNALVQLSEKSSLKSISSKESSDFDAVNSNQELPATTSKNWQWRDLTIQNTP